ncbi:hypothetical protein BDB00DRAFT_839781 [Zychaea mexicana]|uniref:uncharacterized protein n=1 Tax=Zychaea mexicana TaxID=64656 RepID=UPI0022FDC705|nr:uncharacterized protein BDB00DRAFT_839781 [Zychaea mexicana]KAI9490016.1 hypothetical protein BDB00DRAFT_839781 [Zychaea mexicana]
MLLSLVSAAAAAAAGAVVAESFLWDGCWLLSCVVFAGSIAAAAAASAAVPCCNTL